MLSRRRRSGESFLDSPRNTIILHIFTGKHSEEEWEAQELNTWLAPSRNPTRDILQSRFILCLLHDSLDWDWYWICYWWTSRRREGGSSGKTEKTSSSVSLSSGSFVFSSGCCGTENLISCHHRYPIHIVILWGNSLNRATTVDKRAEVDGGVRCKGGSHLNNNYGQAGRHPRMWLTGWYWSMFACALEFFYYYPAIVDCPRLRPRHNVVVFSTPPPPSHLQYPEYIVKRMAIVCKWPLSRFPISRSTHNTITSHCERSSRPPHQV